MSSNKNPKFYARRKDENHKDITDGLNRCGYKTFDTHKQGEGFPDFIGLSKTFIPVLFEVKMVGERLNKQEIKFHDEYEGPIAIIETLEQALDVMDTFDHIYLVSPAYGTLGSVVIRECGRVRKE